MHHEPMTDSTELLRSIRQASREEDPSALLRLADTAEARSAAELQPLAAFARGRAHEVRGDFASARRDLARAIDALAAGSDPWLTAACHTSMGNVLRVVDDRAVAHQMLELAEAQWTALDDPNGRGTVRQHIGSLFAMHGQFEEARQEFHRALDLFRTAKNMVGIGRAQTNLGNISASTAQYTLAVEHYRRALQIYEDNKNSIGASTVAMNLANVYYSVGEYAQALEQYRHALQGFERERDQHGIALLHGNMGMVYAALEMFELAMQHYEKALEENTAIGNIDGMASVYTNMGVCAGKQGDLDACLAFHQQSYALRSTIGNVERSSLVLGNIALALIGLQRYDEAEDVLTQQGHLSTQNPTTLSYRYSNYAMLATERGDLTSAAAHYKRALDEAEAGGTLAVVAEHHASLRTVMRRLRDLDGYVYHTDRYIELSKELQNEATVRRLAVIEAERRVEVQLHERDKERAVLYSALPRDIADRIVHGETIHGDRFQHAAILFTDIAGFTTRTSSMEPHDVLTFLAGLFGQFDDMCATHNVFKIKTIGDAYMCFKGDGTEAENAYAMACVADEIRRSHHVWPDGTPVAIRIGVHIGPVTAGVIGTERLQYDVWGDTVNVASRMESTGEPGRIHVSAEFATTLDRASSQISTNATDTLRSFRLHQRGTIEVKGKGSMATYWLL
ncbi:MAG: tetratricopeptide repeat protein [Bacteroidetes bacterium]|nr:tetratricopeptide repeat protein [Bacteroidota bacterium]